MKSQKRIAFLVMCLFGCLLLVFVIGIRTETITYHVLNDGKTNYTEAYYVWGGESTVQLEEPDFPYGDSEKYKFTGWYYDSDLKQKADMLLGLEEHVDLYAGWVQDNPNTEYLLPEMHVTSSAAFENIDRWEYAPCTINLTNTMLNDCMESVSAQMRGRGNSTWAEFDKKSFKIKFDENQNMFGFGADKDWALLSNSVDYTLMRNKIALNLGHIFELDYTPMCQWVHLFYNEEYQGVYLLCESVETGINRVNIEIPYEPEDITVSFLLELGGELDGFSLPVVENALNNWWENFRCEIIYPEKEVLTQNQQDYMDAYMQLVNTAILSQDWERITELVDIQSFVDWYLVNEIMLNGDMGWSMFAYKPIGEKLYLGPIWDFDQSCGVSVTGGAVYQTWYPDTGSQNAWFNTLIEMEEFKQLIKSRWNEKRVEVQNYLVQEKENGIVYEKDFLANFERWPVIGTISWRIREEIGEMKTYRENVDYLFEWLDNRTMWLDEEINSF